MIKTIFGVLATVLTIVAKAARPVLVGLATVMRKAPFLAAKLSLRAGASIDMARTIIKGVKLAEFAGVSFVTNKLIAKTPQPVRKPLETVVKYMTASVLV